MNDTYAVVQKRAPAPSVSSGSKSLPITSENRAPTSSHHQYDNVRPRTMFTKPTDQLYSTVAPKPNRASNSPTFSPTTTLPLSSSYALAGAPGPPEATANNYSPVNASSAGKEVDRGRFTVLGLLPGGIRSFCCFIPGEIEWEYFCWNCWINSGPRLWDLKSVAFPVFTLEVVIVNRSRHWMH